MSLHQSVGRTSLRRDLIAAKKAIERDSFCKTLSVRHPCSQKVKAATAATIATTLMGL